MLPSGQLGRVPWQFERACALCGVNTRLYPLGLNFAPACEKCCHDNCINATTLHSTNRWGIPHSSPWHGLADHICGTFNVPDSWPTEDRNLPPCVACGHGDNSANHWARFCIVPLLVVTSLLPATQRNILYDLSATVYDLCCDLGKLCMCENPRDSLFWETTPWMDRKHQHRDCAQCHQACAYFPTQMDKTGCTFF